MHTRQIPEGYLFVLPWALTHAGGVNQVVINLARDMQISGDFIPIILIADWDATNPVWEEIEGLKTVRWRIRSFVSVKPPYIDDRRWKLKTHAISREVNVEVNDATTILT